MPKGRRTEETLEAYTEEVGSPTAAKEALEASVEDGRA